ncbi:hypothetical protein PsYK624_143310 [Phanerochaete sordida]|uniref:Uncharacterized protein n=1 Tax=Phanerochaete sordida TaxID=48140 RepID=A0A9P3LKX9_9APHY|nr:hypothetical protein PsYK624_143310 [Phanerochaete sordida]
MASKLFSVLFLASTIAVASARDCGWSGTAPFCDGKCKSPRSFKISNGGGGGGNGAACLTGHKAFCCTDQRAGDGCSWFGTAPLCAGKCPAGTYQITEDGNGDGDTCISGNKVYCCKTPNLTDSEDTELEIEDVLNPLEIAEEVVLNIAMGV